jgi:hypothetical protein
VAALRESTLVDLSGVTFLDVGTSRELVVRSLPYAYRLTLRNPSWQVRASMMGCGFGAWANFRSDRPRLPASPERGAAQGHLPLSKKPWTYPQHYVRSPSTMSSGFLLAKRLSYHLPHLYGCIDRSLVRPGRNRIY